jgi:hypothetical protein
MNQQFTWSVAIVASREAIATLAASIDAAIRAASGVSTMIDVIVNGNPSLAQEAAGYVQSLSHRSSNISLRVWSITTGDKAHAVNCYLHEIYPGAELAYFVDGYAQVLLDAFRLMSEGMAERPNALAISGVPTMGRTARSLGQQMVQEGGGHGTLHALRRDVCLRLRESGFRLPLGLYRVDGLLFAVLAFDLDPACNGWDLTRSLVHPRASWTFRPLRWWRPTDLRTYWKRMQRQAQGTLENLAIREHLAVRQQSPASLPATAQKLVADWLTESPAMARKTFLRQPLCLLAARRLRQPRDWPPADMRPQLLAQVDLTNSADPALSGPPRSSNCLV